MHLPDPVISRAGELGPEEEALLADSVGLALQVVLDALAPAERLAFVLHDMFDLPFDEIAPMVGRSPAAARQLASRARRRVKDATVAPPDPDLTRQRAVVDAFFSAARGRRLRRAGRPAPPRRRPAGRLRPRPPLRVHGSSAAPTPSHARHASAPIRRHELHPALVNGAAGVVITLAGRAHVVMAFTVVGDRIAEIDVFADPERVRRVASAVLGGE